MRDIFNALTSGAAIAQRECPMDTQKLAQQARDLVANGSAGNIEQAIVIVVRAALDSIAGTYTTRAERYWQQDVQRIERATR